MIVKKSAFKKISIVAFAICLIIFCIFFTACTPKGTAVDFVYFNTPIHIETHGSNLSKQTENQLKSLFSALENEFSTSKENSYTYRINNATANTPITINERYAQVFALSKEYHSFTNGLFNPAVYPLVKLWQFDKYPVSEFILPSAEQISTLLNGKVDFDGFTIANENLTITKLDNDLQIDLGGILKGYAVDLAAEILLEAGHQKGYVNIGGSSLYILGVQSLGIRHPRMTNDLPLIISVNLDNSYNVPVSTSGDYEKYYTVGEKNYNHIINSLNGKPTDTGVISATLIGVSGAFGDAMTTAMCLLNHQYGSKNSELVNFIKKVITQYSDCGVYAVYLNGEQKEIITNKKQDKDFTLLDEKYTINQI